MLRQVTVGTFLLILLPVLAPTTEDTNILPPELNTTPSLEADSIASVQGRVVAAQGRPLPSTTVIVQRGTRADFHTETTDRNGQYRITFPHGPAVVVRYYHNYHVPDVLHGLEGHSNHRVTKVLVGEKTIQSASPDEIARYICNFEEVARIDRSRERPYSVAERFGFRPVLTLISNRIDELAETGRISSALQARLQSRLSGIQDIYNIRFE